MYRRLQPTADKQASEDFLDLNSHPPRDFLAETQRCDIVVTHNIWGFAGRSSLSNSGATACSPLHNSSAWRKRLARTGARYIFMFGRHFNPETLDRLPTSYKCCRVPTLGCLSVLSDRRLNLNPRTATQPVSTRDMSRERLRNLSALQANTVLDLSFTRLESKHIAALRKMPRLTNLSLVRTNVSDRDLAQIVQNKGIQTLSLDETGVSDTGMQYVSELRHLQCLSLNHTPVTDGALRHLQMAEKLEWLSLVGTEVGDAGLEFLMKVRSLRYLSLVNTKVTASKVLKLRNALPECWTDFCPV